MPLQFLLEALSGGLRARARTNARSAPSPASPSPLLRVARLRASYRRPRLVRGRRLSAMIRPPCECRCCVCHHSGGVHWVRPRIDVRQACSRDGVTRFTKCEPRSDPRAAWDRRAVRSDRRFADVMSHEQTTEQVMSTDGSNWGLGPPIQSGSTPGDVEGAAGCSRRRGTHGSAAARRRQARLRRTSITVVRQARHWRGQGRSRARAGGAERRQRAAP